MRAISIRPPTVRRNSTSLTSISNRAAGSYEVFMRDLAVPSPEYSGRDPNAGTTTGRPAAPKTVSFLRKSRRPGEHLSTRPSSQSVSLSTRAGSGTDRSAAPGAEHQQQYDDSEGGEVGDEPPVARKVPEVERREPRAQ